MEWKLTYSRRKKKGKERNPKSVLPAPFEDLGLESLCNGKPSRPQLVLRDIRKVLCSQEAWTVGADLYTHFIRAQTFHSLLDALPS